MAVLPGGAQDTKVSPLIPDKVLPAVPLKDLPEAPPLRKVIGPGVVLVATALGSGEYVIWPFVASNLGLTVLWAAIVAVAIQFFINMEVERYTLATGETAITGFTRLWKPWWFLFVVMAVVPNVWPGLASGAATCLSFVVGDLDVTLVAVLGLLAIGITLTASPVVYQTVERLQGVIIAAVVVWLVVAVLLGTTADAWGDFVSGFSGFGSIPFGEDEAVTAAVIAGAIAFAGSGGCGNLAVSNWVRDKGFGRGRGAQGPRRAVVRGGVLDGRLLQAPVDHPGQLRLRQPHHGRCGEDQRHAAEPLLDREPDLRGDGLDAGRDRHRDPADGHRAAAAADRHLLGDERGRDVHLLDPADRDEPLVPAGDDPPLRLPAGHHGARRGLVRLLLRARGHRVRGAAVLMRAAPTVRVRVLLALVVWIALILVAKAIEALF
jgi:hypothetical protein